MCSLDYITNSVCVCVLVTFWGILSICSIIFSYSTGQSSYFSLMLQRQLGLSINCSCKGDGSLLNVTPLSGQMIVIMRSDTGHFFCALVPYELIIILLLESFLKDYSSSSIRGKTKQKEHLYVTVTQMLMGTLSWIKHDLSIKVIWDFLTPHTSPPLGLRALVWLCCVPKHSSSVKCLSVRSVPCPERSLKPVVTCDHTVLWPCWVLSLSVVRPGLTGARREKGPGSCG